MTYEVLASVRTVGGKVVCNNATIYVTGADEAWVIWTGETNYDMDAGNAAHGYSFQGVDPSASNSDVLNAAKTQAYSSLLRQHLADYTQLMAIGSFDLNLGQKPDLTKPTAQLMSEYRATTPDVGDPYIEWLTFNMGRYLLASSARGKIPSNLQGVWSTGTSSPWSAGRNHCSKPRSLVFTVKFRRLSWCGSNKDLPPYHS
jgi:alpha-L-fucosidase 2